MGVSKIKSKSAVRNLVIGLISVIILHTLNLIYVNADYRNNDEIDNTDIRNNTIDNIESVKKDYMYFEKASVKDVNIAVKEDIDNSFSYEPDKALVTFVFDDALQDVDLVASIFSEYNYPLCLAVIPDNLEHKCSGLTHDSNMYKPGMTVEQVAKQVTQQGGEVLSHGYTVLTRDNIDDINVLREIFVGNKLKLTEHGFNVNGIILNGGDKALKGGSREQGGYVMQYYAEKYFLYSDRYGVTEQYYHPRINLNKSTQKCIEDIENAIKTKKWIVFAGHSITGIYNEKYLNEAHLRKILQYCKKNNVDVVTYATVHEKYADTDNNLK